MSTSSSDEPSKVKVAMSTASGAYTGYKAGGVPGAIIGGSIGLITSLLG